MSKPIKLFDPKIDDSEKRIINKVLYSHFWASGEGTNYVRQFENKFTEYIDSDDCVSVNSGTAALNLALSAAKIENTEVILPSLTFVSTANAVMINGAKPVFADIDPINLCINPQSIKKLITKKTSAILPVHFAGMPCALNEIINICKEKNLTLVEDAAHAVGSKYKNKRIGRHGDFVCFSFHPVKNLAMPTGGIISINHKNHKKIRRYLPQQNLDNIVWRLACFRSQRFGFATVATRKRWDRQFPLTTKKKIGFLSRLVCFLSTFWSQRFSATVPDS